MINSPKNEVRSFQDFPCRQCGGKLEFSPKAGRLQCVYCGQEEATSADTTAATSADTTDTAVREIPYAEFLDTQSVKTAPLSETALEVSCPSCRASITFQPPDVAGKCPFCASAIVTQGKKAHPVVEPGGVLPCKVTQKKARENVQKWLGNNWFLPTALKSLAQQEAMQGVYIPYWTYDAKTESQYTGSRGEYYTTTETYTTTDDDGNPSIQTREVQHTRWYPASGHVSRFFDDLLIPATTQLNEKYLDRLSNWKLDQIVPYSPSYLAGFKAQRYQVTLEAGLTLAKSKMASQIHTDVEHDIGGDTQSVDHIQTQHHDITFKHILLPLWLCAYRYKNKQYQVMVNAQTGEVSGERPYSTPKIAIAAVLGMTIVVAFCYALSRGQPNNSPSRTRYRTRIEHSAPRRDPPTLSKPQPPREKRSRTN